MIIWRLFDPRDPTFAEAGWRGAWSESTGQLCPECTASPQHRVQPLILEWEPGSDRIGDFTCTGICDGFAVTEPVGMELQRRFKGFELGPVEMIQAPKLKRPKRLTRRTKPRVWLPYTGSRLYELWLTTWVHMDRERTTAKLVRRCSTCGRERYELRGMEKTESKWDIERREGYDVHTPRTPGGGLYVGAAALEGADIFRVYEFSGWVFCTDRVKRFIEHQEFTNITFMEMGDAI